MLQKNIDKEKRKKRDTWCPFYERVTKDKTKSIPRKEKHKGGKYSEETWCNYQSPSWYGYYNVYALLRTCRSAYGTDFLTQ